MTKLIKKLILISQILLLTVNVSAQSYISLRNENVKVVVNNDASFIVEGKNTIPVKFMPEFTILKGEQDPKILISRSSSEVDYGVASWVVSNEEVSLKDIAKHLSRTELTPYPTKVEAMNKEVRTENYFHAAPSTKMIATSIVKVNNRLVWSFPDHESFSLWAELSLTEFAPRLTAHFKAKKEGYYSIGYTGAPADTIENVDEIWQPLIWQEKRFPNNSFLTLAHRCPIPTSMVTKQGTTIGVIAEASEYPFMPLPTFLSSRFGVSVRNKEGLAQPTLFAPVLGLKGSQMKEQTTFDFNMLLMVYGGDCPSAYEFAARRFYGFTDYRTNANGFTLNQTLENMIDFADTKYAEWNKELKGSNYISDVPGSVKNVSALYSLSPAIVTDNKHIYDEYAAPMLEYMLSREKFLFTADPKITGQSPSWRMKGPTAPVSELAALYRISGENTPVFLYLADSLKNTLRNLNLEQKLMGDTWWSLLGLYQGTGDKTYLDESIKKADIYIAERIDQMSTSFRDNYVGKIPEFMSQFVGMFPPLYTLYEITGDSKYLDAAHEAARRFAMLQWTSPAIPETEVLVNEGGISPSFWAIAQRRGSKPVPVEEDYVDAWKLSTIGLTTEAANTSSKGNRGIFPMNPAAFLLKIARDKNDPFLRDLARSAVIGRYSSFPGYHVNTARTNVYMLPEYPLRPFLELGCNPFHYNHIWPHIHYLIDHLVCDAYYRSDAKINFPSLFGEGYAFFTSNVYGNEPGNFYDNNKAWLWMPKGLIQTGNDQVNYVSARGKNKLFLALLNESFQEKVTEITLNNELIGMESDETYHVRVWKDGIEMRPILLKAGKLSVAISAKGLTGVEIQGINTQPRFQQLIGKGRPLSQNSFVKTKDGTNAMLIKMGENMTTAYIYLENTFKEVTQATLKYRTNGKWGSISDSSYPYEYTVLLKPSHKRFEFYIEKVALDGSVISTKSAILRR